MARPQTKQDLLIAGNKQFNKLWDIIDSIEEKKQKTPFNFSSATGKEAHWTRDKNIRDVLIHLYEWQELLLEWVNANQKGKKQSFLPEPYNWKTYGEMNVEFWRKHQNTSYDKSRKMLKDSHDKVIKLIETFEDDELFSKKYFSWTGGSTLGQYCISVTSSHYDWAMKKVKTHIKSL